MNVFQCSPEERLGVWAEVRDQLHEVDTVEALKRVLQFWSKAPFSKNVIHPLDPENWPTVWEILSDGDMCLNTISLCAAMTIVHSELPNTPVFLHMIKFASGEEQFVVEYENMFIGIEYTEISYEIPEDCVVLYSYEYSYGKRCFDSKR